VKTSNVVSPGATPAALNSTYPEDCKY